MSLGYRAKQISTTEGTGTLTLTSGAATGYQTLKAALASATGDSSGPWTVSYCIIQSDGLGNPVKVEGGTGVLTDGAPGSDTLSRDSVHYSTNSDALESFDSGSKTVIVTPLPDDFSTVQAVELYLNADELILAGETEEVTSWTVKAGGDPNSLWSANQATAPFDALCEFYFAHYSIESTITQALQPQPAIDDVLVIDFSTMEDSGNAGGSPGGNVFAFRVDSGDTVQPYIHNTSTAGNRTLEGTGSGNQTQLVIKFTRI